MTISTLIELIKDIGDLSWTALLISVPLVFLHFHDKLKNQSGRQEVIDGLRLRRVSSTYLSLLDWALKQLTQIASTPFSLNTLLLSLTLAQAYQYATAMIGRSRGGPALLGEVNIFQLDRYSSVEFDYEFGVAVTMIVLTATIVLLPRLFKAALTSIDLPNDSSLPSLKTFSLAMIPCVLIGQAAGGMIGSISGFYAIMLPVCLVFVTVTSMTRWQSMLSFTIIVNALISTLAGIESNAVGNLAPISLGGDLSVIVSVAGLLVLRKGISRSLILHLTGIMTILFSLSYILIKQVTSEVLTDSMLIVGMFWVALPISNGICDYLSLSITTALLQRIRNDWGRGFLLPVGYAVIDLIIASILIAVVAIGLSISFSVCQLMSPKDLRLEEFLVASYSDPLGYGLWMTLMLVTTLVWTAFHFSIIVIAMFSHMYDQNPLNEKAINVIASGADRLWVKIYLSTKLLITVLVVAMVVLLMISILAQVLSHFGFLGTLQKLAIWWYEVFNRV